jgi:hypothetical protein
VSLRRRNSNICDLTCPVKLGQQPQFVLSCNADAASKVTSQSARSFAVTVRTASFDKLPGTVSSLRKSTVVNNPAVATAECVSTGTVNVFDVYVKVPHAGFVTSQQKARQSWAFHGRT